MRQSRRGVLKTFAATAGAATVAAVVPAGAAQASPARQRPTGPLVIAHRGASGYRPEHTLAAYELAVRFGADVIEPDLVITKDGVLVDRHEPEISGTTDVASRPEFASRKVTKLLDGVPTTGWFTEDFTLAELKTLHAVERLPALRQHSTIYNGRYEVSTLQEVIDLRKKLSKEHGREIGIIPEIKHSTYFSQQGLALEDRLVGVLDRNKLDHSDSPVVIQSFEVANLKYLRSRTRVDLAQLTSASGKPYDFVVSNDPRTYADLISVQGLREVARYAQYLGPEKSQIVPRKTDGSLGTPTRLLSHAHAADLKVTPYTFRNENSFLPTNLRSGTDPAAYGDAFAEYELFYSLGVDGVFSDNPDTALAAREFWLASR